jgi:hypothetical protein
MLDGGSVRPDMKKMIATTRYIAVTDQRIGLKISSLAVFSAKRFEGDLTARMIPPLRPTLGKKYASRLFGNII